MPADDPIWFISIDTSGFLVLKASASASITGPTEVDPDILTAFVDFASLPPELHPTMAVAPINIVPIIAINLFLNIFKLPPKSQLILSTFLYYLLNVKRKLC